WQLSAEPPSAAPSACSVPLVMMKLPVSALMEPDADWMQSPVAFHESGSGWPLPEYVTVMSCVPREKLVPEAAGAVMANGCGNVQVLAGALVSLAPRVNATVYCVPAASWPLKLVT